MGLLNKIIGNNVQLRPIENVAIKRLVPQCQKFKVDTLFISTRNSCDLCKQYNRKVYSLYGWNRNFPKLPDVLLQAKCPVCGKSIGATFYFPEINAPNKKY